MNDRIDIAKRHAAKARRHMTETRLRLNRLRASGADTKAAEAQLEAALPIVERFEAYIRHIRKSGEAARSRDT